jgi:hypothetical protein
MLEKEMTAYYQERERETSEDYTLSKYVDRVGL